MLVHGGPGLDDQKGLLEAFQKNVFEETDPDISHIVAYDQLGCGQSDKPETAEFYTLDSYVQELEQVLRWTEHNVCTKLFVLGHSWGGQVVLEMLLRQTAAQSVLRGAVISNSPLDEHSYEVGISVCCSSSRARLSFSPVTIDFFSWKRLDLIRISHRTVCHA